MDISWKYKHLKPLNYLVVQKKLTDKTKNGEVVNQHQQKSEVL